jgi:hypothetical protein
MNGATPARRAQLGERGGATTLAERRPFAEQPWKRRRIPPK